MDNTVWEKAKQVFGEALEETGSERRSVIEAACGADPEVLAQVEVLLAAHEAAGEFLGEVTVAPAGAGFPPEPGPDPLGLDGITERSRALQAHLAGRYSFEGELGRGGMGVGVWLVAYRPKVAKTSGFPSGPGSLYTLKAN